MIWCILKQSNTKGHPRASMQCTDTCFIILPVPVQRFHRYFLQNTWCPLVRNAVKAEYWWLAGEYVYPAITRDSWRRGSDLSLAAAILPHAMMLGRIRTIYARLSGPGVLPISNISIVIYLPFCLAETYLYVLKLKCCLRQTFIGQHISIISFTLGLI